MKYSVDNPKPMQKDKKRNNKSSIDSAALQCTPDGSSGESWAANSLQDEKIKQMVREEVATQSKTMIGAVGEAVSKAISPIVELLGGIFHGILAIPGSPTPCTNSEGLA